MRALLHRKRLWLSIFFTAVALLYTYGHISTTILIYTVISLLVVGFCVYFGVPVLLFLFFEKDADESFGARVRRLCEGRGELKLFNVAMIAIALIALLSS